MDTGTGGDQQQHQQETLHTHTHRTPDVNEKLTLS